MGGRTRYGVGFVAIALLALGCKKGDAAATSESASKGTEVGVTDDRVAVGQAAVFIGPSAGLGTELWRGAAAYFAEVNSQGGVFGRKIDVVARDDGYDPTTSVDAFKKLLDDDKVFTFFGSVGTPTLYAVLPELEKAKAQNVVLFSNYTGAQKQREAPFLDQVFNVRASYYQETREIVEAYLRAGHRKLGVFIQDDSYGETGLNGVKLAIKAANDRDPSLHLTDPVVTKYDRGQKFEASTARQVDELRSKGVDAIVSVGVYQPCAAFVRDARNAGFSAPIANVSFVGADTLIRFLSQYERESGKKVISNLIASQVVPPWEAVEIPAVSEYRNLVEKRNPRPPSELQDPNYHSLEFSFAALEGFVNAKVFTEALRRAGQQLTRQSFISAIQSIREWDPGLGATVTFGPNDNQGLDKVWLTGAKDGSWLLLSDPKTFMNLATVAAKPSPSQAKK